jgi:glycosyltransferase involved in cell wall biosynthesis
VEDELFYHEPLKEPWVGFIHQVPRQRLSFPDLERLIELPAWKESIDHCLGLWVLCDYYRHYLKSKHVSVPISKVYYPNESPERQFSFAEFVANPEKKLVFIGEFLRNYQYFYDLPAAQFEKVLLKHHFFELHVRKLKVQTNDSVRLIDRLTDQQYDSLLSDNIVFLNLFDAGANTTVVECISRGTPILINKVGAVVEYLGKDYPFYYATQEEAVAKLSDMDIIGRTAEYLQNSPIRKNLSNKYFQTSIQNTSVYRSLPIPKSQQTEFKSYAVSIILCSYKRVHNLREILSRLADQQFSGAFEVILWNNNPESVAEVNAICRDFDTCLSLKVIHSSKNFYCIIRMAVANLARGELLLICDDDVLPEKDYIATFVAKYRQYGPEAVICARGHLFLPHTLDEDNPEEVWAQQRSMEFYDQSEPDRQLHFLHADNCLIPKSILKRAIPYEMDRYEFALVDDYWLSFILSFELKVPIWKIRADHILSFTNCADDADLAMFHNPMVSEQRVNFYIYHMRKGWPAATMLKELKGTD